LRFLRAELPDILAAPSDALSPRMVRIIEDLAGDWRRLTRASSVCRKRLKPCAPDRRLRAADQRTRIGPSSPARGSGDRAGDVFSKGRDFAAWLGLVPGKSRPAPHHPRQDIETGNRYLRVRAGRVGVLIKPKSGRHGLKS